MAGYGSWEDRPWERREGGRDWDRWRREQQERMRREGEPWREREYEGYGGRPGSEGMGYRTYGGGEERWGDRGYPRELREYRPEGDRPWVERGPSSRGREPTRGLVEWEDRGPLEWLGHKVREATGRPGRGPKGYTRSDERIHDEVCERIARSGVDADDVEVKVANREVTLSGTVASREHKWWLENIADDVFGVEEIHNHLRVARPEASERAMAGRTTTTTVERREDPNLRH